jgi:hypothetical protein
MRQALALVLLAPAVAGCSLIYNPNNLPNPHDGGAEIILDADPSMLVVTGVAPAVIHEGQGDGGSPPAMLVIAGHQMVDANTLVELLPQAGSPSATPPVVGTPVVAKDGDWIAVPITAHVDPGLASSQQITFDVRVSEDIRAQPGMRSSFTLTGQLMLQGHSELTVAKGKAATIDVGTLEAMYSQVDLESDVTFTGSARAIVHAVSSIVTQGITANGKAGGDAQVGSAWLGGCNGGGPSSAGLCNGGQGGQFSGSTLGGAGGGGGGGGFATDGNPGNSAGHGGPGAKTGDDLIVTYDGTGASTPNKSEGGGGGGASGLLNGTPGGAGGGGGGTVEFTAGGDVTINGAISAKGGGGQNSGGAAGGGGGAGGLVMLRAGGTLAATAGIAVDGGAGGTPSGSNGAGGAGSAGRVRWDAVKGAAPAQVSAGSFRRGPAFTLDSALVRDAKPNITVVADANVRFSTYAVNFGVDGPTTTLGGEVSTGTSGTASFSPTLGRGLTQLCLTLDGGAQGSNEADKCVFVAYLP